MRVQRPTGLGCITGRVEWDRNKIDLRVWRDCLEFCVNNITKAEILMGIEIKRVVAEVLCGVDIWGDFLKEKGENNET